MSKMHEKLAGIRFDNHYSQADDGWKLVEVLDEHYRQVKLIFECEELSQQARAIVSHELDWIKYVKEIVRVVGGL